MKRIKYEAFFIGVRSFVHSPRFTNLQSAKKWIARNRHRVVEDLQIIKYDLTFQAETEWFYEDGKTPLFDTTFKAMPRRFK